MYGNAVIIHTQICPETKLKPKDKRIFFFFPEQYHFPESQVPVNQNKHIKFELEMRDIAAYLEICKSKKAEI